MKSDPIAPFLSQLRQVPFIEAARWKAPTGAKADGRVVLRTPRGPVELRAELKKSHLTREVVERVIADSSKHLIPLLLLAPYVGAPLGDRLADARVNFIDHEGNCHIRIGDQYVARVQRKSRARRTARDKGVRAPGYQVLFTLLAEQNLLHESVRAIAERADVSRQAVSDMLLRFVEEQWATRRGRTYEWVPHRRRHALDAWLSGYATTLRPHLRTGSFRTPMVEPAALEDWLETRLAGIDFRYGGTAAAERLHSHYRGHQTVLHLTGPAEPVVRALEAIPDERGPLVLLGVPSLAAFDVRREPVVHPLLVYTELIVGTDDRAVEAAQMIRERYLPWSL